jgi:uncharacterized protein YjaZ
MTVANTQRLLKKMIDLPNQILEEKIEMVQKEIICEPLMKFFPNVSMEELHFELLNNGLFDPYEGMDLGKVIRELEEQKVWQIVKREYKRLKFLWKGPEVPIYIYPLTKHRPIVEGNEVTKNGVAYNGIVFLFVSTELEEKEIKALFAHEYHHICRLAYLNKAPQEMLLKDSLIIEGLAESAVEKLYGERWLSPWTKRYTFDEAIVIWKEHFVPVLNLKGVINHQPFLYGNPSEGLPQWIGYTMGYRLVQSYLKNKGPQKEHILNKTPTEIIIEGSDFAKV